MVVDLRQPEVVPGVVLFPSEPEFFSASGDQGNQQRELSHQRDRVRRLHKRTNLGRWAAYSKATVVARIRQDPR